MIPVDWMFVNAMITDALGTPYTMFSTLDEGYYWAAVEAGFVIPPFSDDFDAPSSLSFIWSRQNLDALAASPRRQISNSLAVQFQGHLSRISGFGSRVESRRHMSESSPSSPWHRDGASAGREGDLLGVAFNWSRPSSALGSTVPGLAVPDEQSMMELFYRIQLTSSCQLTPDLRSCSIPAIGPTDRLPHLRSPPDDRLRSREPVDQGGCRRLARSTDGSSGTRARNRGPRWCPCRARSPLRGPVQDPARSR